ncbi:hypothetical protein CIG75_10995 [Tumebacillus algifaecis]|uniref:YcaO domain-containing protein n=1 Tax=Tumebacillus algifaecis TaxID=1214604 RepID=A0A223D117_9BACL|nr:hypothetical protein [Tumebacillus algifaecis]ASS75449.1 hypothetical protein CIG75_10995 [Tumebacillus algifaecis]
MKPKYKPHVHYAATDEGVYFRTWTNEFVIKGQTIYQWVEQVFPYLTGERTLDELVAPLPEAQANFVRTLVHELVRRGVVIDATSDSEVPISESEQTLYKQSLLFLEDQASNGRELFRRYRDRQVLLTGSGLSFRALVRALIKMGLRAPMIAETDDAELRNWIDRWKERDAAFDPAWITAGRKDTWLREQTERPSLVVHVSDAYEEAAVGQLIDVCAELKIPALIGTQLSGLGVIGPLLDEEATTSWHCLLDRFVPLGERLVESESPIFQVMIGNVAALEAFKAITALDTLSVRDQVALIDPRELEAKHHRLWPSPLQRPGKSSAEQGMERFLQVQEAEPLRDFLGHLEEIKDDRVGVLSLLHPGDLWQLPFAHAQAVVRLPGAVDGRALAVVTGGEQIDEAMEMAVREGLTAYARFVEEQVSSVNLSIDAAWSHGRDVHEWQGRGILQALIERAGRLGTRLEEFTGVRLEANVEQSFLKMLTLRYGLQVRLFAVDLGVSSAHQVRIWCDNQWIASGIGRTRREALKAALLQALSACQLQENHPERAAAATAEPAQLPERVEQVEWVPEAESLTWQAWNSEMHEQLLFQGITVVSMPWLVDEAPLQYGVLIGQIGLEEVSAR